MATATATTPNGSRRKSELPQPISETTKPTATSRARRSSDASKHAKSKGCPPRPDLSPLSCSHYRLSLSARGRSVALGSVPQVVSEQEGGASGG